MPQFLRIQQVLQARKPPSAVLLRNRPRSLNLRGPGRRMIVYRGGRFLCSCRENTTPTSGGKPAPNREIRPTNCVQGSALAVCTCVAQSDESPVEQPGTPER